MTSLYLFMQKLAPRTILYRAVDDQLAQLSDVELRHLRNDAALFAGQVQRTIDAREVPARGAVDTRSGLRAS